MHLQRHIINLDTRASITRNLSDCAGNLMASLFDVCRRAGYRGGPAFCRIASQPRRGNCKIAPRSRALRGIFPGEIARVGHGVPRGACEIRSFVDTGGLSPVVTFASSFGILKLLAFICPGNYFLTV